MILVYFLYGLGFFITGLAVFVGSLGSLIGTYIYGHRSREDDTHTP